ncbi:hypothetical protein Leryth_007393 [Lithospermum erythrorhizon]|nr:hypothetical protein Leryth_007393 [Lithospermum erythrorhizon]
MSSTMNTLRHQLKYKHASFFTPTPKTCLQTFKTPSFPKQNIVLSTHKCTPLESKQLLADQFAPLTTTTESSNTSSKGVPRMVIFGAASIGVVLFLMGFDDQKALALGPEGPLMEEFWDNMRRYALYALTVSTGALSVLIEPIVELLKNPISAVLIITIIGGGIFIVSQVVSAMVGFIYNDSKTV